MKKVTSQALTTYFLRGRSRFGVAAVLALFALSTLGPALGSVRTGTVPVPEREDKPSGCPGESPPDQPKPVFPSFPSPPPGTVLFDVVVSEEVSSGSPFAVLTLTTRPQMPLDGVTLVLRDLDFNEVGRAVTSPEGHAVLNAPVIEIPQAFFVEATREGAANFIPPEDARALDAYDCTTGFYPINFVSVLPEEGDLADRPLSAEPSPRPSREPSPEPSPRPSREPSPEPSPRPSREPSPEPSPRPSPEPQKLEIDEGLGWGTAISFSELIKKAKNKGFDADEDWWARRTDINEHLAEKDGKDVYIFFGHGGDTDGDTSTVEGLIGWSKFMWLRGGRFKSLESMIKSVKSDEDPPGIVFLGTCSSHSLLQPLVDASVKLAVGFTNCLSLGGAGGALKQFWEALLDGKTLGQALDAANKYLDNLSPSFNAGNADMVFKGKAWVTRDMTLEEIKHHER